MFWDSLCLRHQITGYGSETMRTLKIKFYHGMIWCRKKETKKLFSQTPHIALKLINSLYFQILQQVFSNQAQITNLYKIQEKLRQILRQRLLSKIQKLAYLTSNQLQANVETKFINEHQGYSQGNIDLDRYGKNYYAEIICENVTKRIVYESSRGRKIDYFGLKVEWGGKDKNVHILQNAIPIPIIVVSFGPVPHFRSF